MLYHFDFNTIPGFGPVHDFADFYEEAVRVAPPGSTLVEVGNFHGRSLVQLGLCAKAANKGLKVFGVDHGNGMGDGKTWPTHNSLVANLKKASLENFVELIRLDSVDGAKRFADESVWLCFIDAAHLHDAVFDDIVAWMPKITKDSWLTGHDFQMYTVAEPVIAMFGEPTFDPDKDSGAGRIIYDERWPDIWIVKKCEYYHADIHSGTSMPKKRKNAWPA